MEPKLLTAERFVDTDNGISYRYVHSSTEYFRPHYHDYFEIFISLSGSANHLVNNERIPILRGSAVFVRPSDTHDYVCTGKEAYSMLNVTFTSKTFDELFLYIGTERRDELLCGTLPPTVSLNESELKEIEADMTHIRLIENDKKALKSALRCFLLKLIAYKFLFRGAVNSREIPAWLIELRSAFREDKNFIEGISALPRLSDKSREHICRCMKKHYGITMSEYINDLRLSYIANMLVYSNHDILDIIFESGFGNVSWCYKCFEKKYGVSLSVYRNNSKV